MNLLGRLIVILYHYCMMAKEFHNTELCRHFSLDITRNRQTSEVSDTGSNGGLFAAESPALVPTTDLTYHIHSLREFFPGGSSGGSSSSGGTGGGREGGRGGVGGQEATKTGTGVSEGPVFDEGWERLSPRVSMCHQCQYCIWYSVWDRICGCMYI